MRQKELKPIMTKLLAEGRATVECVNPRIVKDALSRYKQSAKIEGTLSFDVSVGGFTPADEPLFKLEIYYARDGIVHTHIFGHRKKTNKES